MFLIKEKRKKGTNLCIVQSYRDPVTKASKTKRILNIGYLEELRAQYEDPIAHFQEVAKKMSEEYRTETKPLYIALDPTKTLEPGDDLIKNFGYTALSALYHELKLDVFFRGRQRFLNIDFSLNSVIKLLVYGRILFPGSERRIFEKKEQFFDKMDFSLNDIYRSYTYLHRYKTQLQEWIQERLCENYGRDTSLMYYYVTNHYFEIGEQDRIRKTDLSKEHRPDPIVQMGLYVDQNELPVSYDLLPRNTNDLLALSPALKKARRDFGVDKVVIVADNGINSSDSLYYVLSAGNDYIVSQNIRSASKEIRDYVLNQEGYVPFDEEYKIKSRIYTRKIRITTTSGRKKVISFDEKQIVFHNERWARCARAGREDVLTKAKDLIGSPGKFYAKNSEHDKINDILSDKQLLHLNEERLKEDEKYDGYYIILTSQLDQSEAEIFNAYVHLWDIEEAFKIKNSTFRARPAFVSRGEHIHAHFLTCFVSLVLTRILEMKIQKRYSLNQMIKSLRCCNYVQIEGNHYIQTYYDSVLDLIGKSIGVDFSKRFGTLAKIKEYIGSTKKRG